MPAAVIPIRQNAPLHTGVWSLLELAPGGAKPRPLGILLIDRASGELFQCHLGSASFGDLNEQEIDIVDLLPEDLRKKAAEWGADALLRSLGDSLSGFLRVSDRTAIEFKGSPQRAADHLFGEYVDSEVRPFVTHLPLYSLRAAATRFGEGTESGFEEWVRVPAGSRLTDGMFLARVVGRSMEPLIPDDSLCIFRAGVTGSRQGRRLLIEKFSETDFAARYTVKRYTSHKVSDSEGSWQHDQIRLEPLNPEFEAFNLSPDEFRVIAEFVSVLA